MDSRNGNRDVRYYPRWRPRPSLAWALLLSVLVWMAIGMAVWVWLG